MNNTLDAYGVVKHTKIVRKDDYLFRISMKALVVNEAGDILVVKESGRDYWDIPGGGLDHGENIKDVIRRELEEEVNLSGEFTYDVLLVENPTFVDPINMWQMRIIFLVRPENLVFSPGEDGDELKFVTALELKESDVATERVIYEYSLLADKHISENT